jgi:two-component system, NtrC family, response regulator PilR
LLSGGAEGRQTEGLHNRSKRLSKQSAVLTISGFFSIAMPTVLVVDDEPHIIDVIEIVLHEEGARVLRAGSGLEALELLRRETVDVVISDIRMPDLSGVQLLKEAKPSAPATAFILITAFATNDTAIEALQHGACEYLTKPFKMDDLRCVVRKHLSRKSSEPVAGGQADENERLHGQQLFQALHRTQLVGRSPKMLEIYRTIGTVACSDSTILITGESGTGKGLIARAVHETSSRRDRPLVSINCGAFPETLLESELFGTMKGAFTGATTNRKGLFESADGGSIFLDEIGETTAAMQVKMLRVLQEKKLRPLGGTAEVSVDVRVIAATNQDLQTALVQGRFREDLYYRIAVITLQLPPLRERQEDIAPLAYHFLNRCATKAGKKVTGLSPEALERLQSYFWPGNVRELENTIERAVALESTSTIGLAALPEVVALGTPVAPARETIPVPDGPFALEKFLADLQRDLICRALRHADGNQTVAAQLLCLTKPALRHRILALGIDAGSFRRNADGTDAT